TFDGRGGAEVFGQTPCLDGDRRRHRFSFSTARRSMTAITTKNHRTGKIGHQGPGPDHPFSCASATKSIMFTLLVDVPKHEPCRRAEARIAHTIDSRARRWKIHRTGEANRSATPGVTAGRGTTPMGVRSRRPAWPHQPGFIGDDHELRPVS